MQKHRLILASFLFFAPCAWAQFARDEEPAADSVESVVDNFDAALRTPALEPIRPLESMISPVVTADQRVEPCDLEPDVAQVYRASVLPDSTRDPLPVTSRFDEADCPQFLGRLSANPYASDSTANPYSTAGSPYSAESVNNPFGPYGSPYSATSARNPYATDAPKIVAQDGTYLGELSANPYDPDSVSNPYGRYGSPYSSTSINNPYSTYGSPYSSQSPNNPYATQAPLLFGD